MSLAERFARSGRPASNDKPNAAPDEPQDATAPPSPSGRQKSAPGGADKAEPPTAVAADDPVELRKNEIRQLLYRDLGTRLYDPDMSTEELGSLVVEHLADLLRQEANDLLESERDQIFQAVRDDVLGYGPIQEFLEDSDITEIMVNGTNGIYIEQKGRLTRTNVSFESEEHLRRVIERMCAAVGRRIDESSPMVDARLEDGSRVNAIIPPLAVSGSALTIRKFSDTPLTIEQLVASGSLTAASAQMLDACVLGRLNVVVSGGTGTGKTTMLNILSGFIPGDQRIVTIEDSVELQMRQEHVITLETRPPNVEGRGQITIRDLVKNSLRMRPDRIVIGECRGAEALDMLQAMNTGHEGSLTTAHANSPRDMLSRLETMVLMAGLDLPIRAIRDQIAGAVDLIVQLTRLNDGRRAITAITEVVGMEGDIITLSDLFAFNWDTGRIEATGVRPQFEARLAAHDVTLDNNIFMSEPTEPEDEEPAPAEKSKSKRSLS